MNTLHWHMTPPQKAPYRPLLLPVGIAVVLHALLFYYFTGNTAVLKSEDDTAPKPIAIRIPPVQTPPPPVVKTQPKPPPPVVKKAITPKPAPTPQPKPKPAPKVVEPIPAPPEPVTADPAPVEPPAPPVFSVSDKENYLALVKQHIQTFKRYPASAKRRRLKGQVTLAVHWRSSTGQLEHLSIAQSSGHKQLDKAALAMVRKAIPLPAPNTEVEDDLFKIRLPVNFSFR